MGGGGGKRARVKRVKIYKILISGILKKKKKYESYA